MNNFIRSFKKRIRNREIKIAVVGLGYVGLPLAIEFARKGFSVMGFDLDKERVEGIKKNISYIGDVSSRDLKKFIISGKFSVSSDFRALKEADVVSICVPTPLKRKYSPDISFIKSAVHSISHNIKKGVLIILESTTFPGTTEEIILPIFQARGLKQGRDFYLCFSPERIDPGNTSFPLYKIPKVIGGLTPETTILAEVVYRQIITKVVPVSNARTAETVKLLENTFRLINIALIDEIAMMAHKMDMDIWEIVDAAKTKPFGFMPFYPGPGVGGHCIPKDPLYLYWKAKRSGFSSRFIKLASDVISRMPEYVVGRLEQILKKGKLSLNKSQILVIGATYKKDIKDLRKSPALDIIDILQKKVSRVAYYDPLVPYLKIGEIDLKAIKLTVASLRKFDCVVIATDHSAVDYKLILENSRIIFDTRNIYKSIKVKKIIKL